MDNLSLYQPKNMKKNERKEEMKEGRREKMIYMKCLWSALCTLDAFIQSITFTSQGPQEVVFFLKEAKRLQENFL